MPGLTPEQEQLLDQFVEITSWDKDRALASRLLATTNWSLETAVALYFEGGAEQLEQLTQQQQSPPPPLQQEPTRTSLLEELNALQPEQDIAPRINPNPAIYTPQGGGFSIIQTVLFAPLTLGYKAFNTLVYWLSMIFPFLPRLFGYYPANRNATRVGSESMTGKGIALRFIRNFEEKHGENDLPFFEGGYAEAYEYAKTNLSYLIVVLESPEHDLTESFNRQVLLHNQVVSLMKRDNVVLWVGDVKESEAYQVSSGLEVTKFPYIALIAPSPKTPTSNNLIMTVLTRLKGVMDGDTVVSSIEEKMEEHQPKLMSLILDKQERDSSRQLREEQDSAYERSLRADQEREERAKREREEQERAEQALKEQQEQAEMDARRKELWMRWRATTLPAEPKEGNCARVGLRLLTGERVARKFNADASIEEIYAFVECYHLIKDGFEPMSTQPAGYKHEYSFELVSPFPRKALEPSTEAIIKDENTIFPNGSLVVELKDEDDD